MSRRVRLEWIDKSEPDAAERASARQSSGGVVVSCAEEYLPARRHIRDWLSNPDSTGTLDVLLVGKRYRIWCDDLLRIGVSGGVEGSHVGRRAEAEKAWRVTLPDGLLTDELIILLGDERLAPLAPGSTYVDYLLERSGGSVWSMPTSAEHMVRIVASLLRERPDLPWINKRQVERLLAWSEQTTGPLSSVYHALHYGPKDVARSISAWWASRHLPDDVRLHVAREDHQSEVTPTVLRQSEGVFRTLSAQTSSMLGEIEEAGQDAISSLLEEYWLGVLAKSMPQATDLAEVMNALPLVSVEELRALKFYRHSLASLQGDVSPEAAARVEELAGEEEAIRLLVKTIRSRVRPPAPSLPEPAWSQATTLEPWSDWLDTYLPFRHAAEHAQLSEDEWKELENGARAFGDWYVGRYSTLLRQKGTTLLDVAERVQELLGTGQRVFWVVWDNLPYVYAERIRDAFADHDLHLHCSQKRLALLPSVTKVSCAALLAGALGTKSGNDGYKASLQERFGDLYFVNRLSLKGIVASQLPLAVLHFTQFDSLLHKAEHEYEESLEAHVLSDIDRHVEAIAEAFKTFQGRQKATLVLSTDHGSTRLPPSYARTYPLPPHAHEIDAMGARAVLTPSPVDYDPLLAYTLDASETGLGGTTYMPRGFASWKVVRQGSGSLHGGPLPEEVVVPVMEFSAIPPSHQPLNVQLDEVDLRAGIEQKIVLFVRNPSSRRAIFRAEASSGAHFYATTDEMALGAGREKRVELSLQVSIELSGKSLPLRIRVLVEGEAPVQAEYQVQIRGGALRSESDGDLFDFD